VSIAINNLVKLIAVSIMLVGCATKSAQPFAFTDLDNWQNDCGQAKRQVEYLQQRLDSYREYFKDHPITTQSQKYVGKLKNNLWSLRSSCSALQQ
jgi:predicted translin family RNA/ssDNA-binding protein